MNKFLLFVVLSLVIHSTLSEKSKTPTSIRTKKEGGTHHKTYLSQSGTSLDSSFSNGGVFSSEDTSSHLSNDIVTPPPENILNTPVANNYNQNPLFSNGYNSAFNQGSFGYNSKTPFLSSYKFGSVSNDGAYKSNLHGSAYSTYNQAQGNYYPGYSNYQGYQNYPGIYNDGYYNAYNHSAYSSKNPSYESGYYSGIHYPYQNSYSGYGYTPLNSGYAGYSGYDSSKYYGGTYKPSFGTSSFSSTPSISSGIYSPSYKSGSSSSSFGKTGSGAATSGAVTSNIYGQYQSSPSYPYTYPGYTNYQTGNYGYQSYKPYTSGTYDYKYNYQALPGVTSTVSPAAPFSKSASSSSSTGFGTSSIGSKPVSTPNLYNYPGYNNYLSGSYKPYVSGGYDSSSYNFPGYTSTVSPLSLSKSSSSGIYTATGTINPGVSSSTGISGGSKTDIFGKYTPASPVHSYNYPGYNNYQTGIYNYGAYKPYTSGYGNYDYSKQNVGYPQYQVNKAAEIKYTSDYDVYGPVTTPASISTTSSPFKSTKIPSVIPNAITSTPVPPLSSFDTSKSSFGTYKFNNYGSYPSTYSGYNYPGYQQSHSYYHSGAYNDGSYKPNTYQYPSYPSYQGAFNQGTKYSPSFFPTVAPSVTPAISSGIAGSGLSSYSGSNLAGKSGSSSADGSIQSIYSNSYDFSSYGKNLPSFPGATIKPVAYQGSSYNYPYQYGGYQDSSYKSGVNYPYFNNYGYSKYNEQYPGYVSSVDGSGKYLSGYHAGQYYSAGGLHNFPDSLSYVSSGQSIFPSTTTVAPIESTTIKK